MLTPGWVAQLIRALSCYTKVVGSIPSENTQKKKKKREREGKLK